jgi:DNA repair exonuclease SbcCD ATPase subunit
LIIWFEFFYQNKKKEKRQMKMNPTLISGFEDVITHINQQEQRVMGLEEENKKLKADIKKFQEENEKLGAGKRGEREVGGKDPSPTK